MVTYNDTNPKRRRLAICCRKVRSDAVEPSTQTHRVSERIPSYLACLVRSPWSMRPCCDICHLIQNLPSAFWHSFLGALDVGFPLAVKSTLLIGGTILEWLSNALPLGYGDESIVADGPPSIDLIPEMCCLIIRLFYISWN